MEKPPFKTQGIYVRKVIPEKELENYKSTKLGKMWKVAVGEKDENIYEIVRFEEHKSFHDDHFVIEGHSVEFRVMRGEILDLADWIKNKPLVGDNVYNNIKYEDIRVLFEGKDRLFRGLIQSDILKLEITIKNTRERFSSEYRYIPWIQ